MARLTPSPSRRTLLLGTLALPWASGVAQTETASGTSGYPSRLVRIVVPYSPGTGSDLLARLLSERLAPRLGQAVIVESKPGASGMIGTAAVAAAAPDGHTLMVTPPTHVINSVMRKTPYDPLRDFEAVAQIARSGLVLIVPAGQPAAALPALVAHLRSQGDNATYSSAGIGSTLHLYTAQFQQELGLNMRHIPSKGAPGAVMDVAQGQVSMAIVPLDLARPHLRSGRVKALAQTGRSRSPLLPDVPTFAEGGQPSYEVELWYAVYAPARTPRPIVDRLNREIVAILSLPEVRKALEPMGMDPAAGSPEQLAALSRSEHALWASLVQRTGIKAD
jgi:tripartite-type tricarboxylate transporter receptor subunit TctC